MNTPVLWNMKQCTVMYVKYISVENAPSIFRKMETGGSKMRGLHLSGS